MIYVLEDDGNIRKLICYALEREGYEVMGFGTPEQFHRQMEEALPELVMLDIMLPGEDGLTILDGIRNDPVTRRLPVIMLTARSSEIDKATGLDRGADDYIAKPFGVLEMTSRVRAVLRRAGMNETVARQYQEGILYVDAARHIIRVDGKDVTLSYKEYRLLLELLEAEGRVVPREELLSKIWGEFYGESRTLDMHISNLREKLGKVAGKYIQTVKGIGYKIDADNSDRTEKKERGNKNGSEKKEHKSKRKKK